MALDIKEYRVDNLADKLEPEAYDVILASLEYQHLIFGDNVDYEDNLNMTLLCKETEEYFYAEPTPPHYERGSRPTLEKIVSELTARCKTDLERVIAFAVYIRDLKEKSHGYDYFYGGTEEELIKKGERYCERVSRIMSGFCDIAGIPSRLVWHSIGGHMTNEVYVDGKWGYIDTRFCIFYLDEEGRLMSLAELVRRPEMIKKQRKWVYDLGSKEYTPEFMMEESEKKYLSADEIQLLAPYSLRDADKYHFEWTPGPIYNRYLPERMECYKKYADAAARYNAKKENKK